MFYIKLSSFKNNYKKILKKYFLGIFLFRRRNYVLCINYFWKFQSYVVKNNDAKVDEYSLDLEDYAHICEVVGNIYGNHELIKEWHDEILKNKNNR